MPIIVDCKQHSEQWHKARLGIPTASKFNQIVTPTGKLVQPQVRQKYLYKLAAESISGIPTEDYVSWGMEKAAKTEEESRMVYAMNHEDLDVYQVGFVYHDEKRMFGSSPDALVDTNGGFETKGAQGDIQVDRLLKGVMINEHIPQVQGNLYVCEREWWDFQSYSPGLKQLCIRNYRDEKYIKLLADELERFCYELAALTAKLRGM